MEKEYEVRAEAYATEYAQGLPVATAEPVMGEVVGVQGSSRQFVFQNVSGNRFDGAGAIQNLPRNGVEVDFSADAANYYSRSTGHRKGDRSAAKRMILAPEGDFSGDHATQWSLGAPGAWFSIRLVNHALRPTHYVYRGDMGGGGNHPRTWTLEASADGQNWTPLREHRNDSTVTNNSAGGWPLEAESYFSYFRIRNCGPPNHLCCSGVDLYGDLVDRPGAGAAPGAAVARQEMNRVGGPPDLTNIFDRTKYPNGGPRHDQDPCGVTVVCLPLMVLCPLSCLATHGCADLVDGLTSLPCKFIPCSICDPNAMNPLWFCSQAMGWAATFGQLHTVMVLAKNGADLDRVNLAGFNARSDAEREGHQHIVQWYDEWVALGRPRNCPALPF